MTEVSEVASLILDIQTCLHRAQQSVDHLGQMVETKRSVQNGQYDDEYDEEESGLTNELKNIYTRICALLERLDLPQLLGEFRMEFSVVREHLTQIGFGSDPLDYTNGAVSLCWKYLGAIRFTTDDSVIAVERQSKVSLFEAVLRNTPLIIADRDLDPNNETKIKNAVYQTLRYIFPDTQREFPVPQITKNYSIDIVVPSLKAGAEFKFVDSMEEAKHAVDQLYGDMHGYSGSDLNRFYAVVYSSVPRFTQEQLEAQLKKVGANPKWKIFAVHGPGGRSRKDR